MVDLAAKWGKMIYEEEMQKIGQVSIPHETIQTLIEQKTPTPGVTQIKIQPGLPRILEQSPLKTAEQIGGALLGSREDILMAGSEFIPIDVITKTIEAPEYNVIMPENPFKSLQQFFKTGSMPQIEGAEFPGSVIETETGLVENVGPEDFTINLDQKDFTDFMKDFLDQAKELPGVENFLQETPTGLPDLKFDFPAFEWPDLGDIGKYLLIAAAVIGGLYLAGKYLGGKK